ncbi:MAG: ATP-dependent DNA helicase RecG [Lachnospiraceae bacterium]|nr:ATP-dependent DNA helicase RecG [Lachnospiraceae bacterium]
MIINENTPIAKLKGVGEQKEKAFAKLGIQTIGDILSKYPRGYTIFDKAVPLSEAAEGRVMSFEVFVMNVSPIKRFNGKSMITVIIGDETGRMNINFFNQPYIGKNLQSGTKYVIRGTVKRRGNALSIGNPRVFPKDEYDSLVGVMQPLYPLTSGITAKFYSKIAHEAFEEAAWDKDIFDDELRERYSLMSKEEAVRNIHFPKDEDSLKKARNRLAFEEFFFFLLVLKRNRSLTEFEKSRFSMIETADTKRLIEGLPYELTSDQKKAWKSISGELEGGKCMNRLLQGDVGCGKTVIAILALLKCAANGYQGALMAPTEVLARQHLESVNELIKAHSLCLTPVLLVGSMTIKEKKIARRQIESGEANLIIGTHALIQANVEYKDLALIVCDEQHRFGVRQRESLAEKGDMPHVLAMSATPIPRTLAIVLYGDLSVSTIKSMPGGRLPVKNCVVGHDYRNTAYRFITDQVSRGRQAYIICPMIEADDESALENVEEYTEMLKEVLPPSVRIESLHGKMKPADKNAIMERFAAGQTDVLISTTVIEVGVNVPNATVMMIEDAEKFGLAQLHQLRGRIGRGKYQSYCIFMSSNDDDKTRERLKILEKSNDGFEIASEDLKLRGPGELMGIRQSGDFAFEIADIYADSELLMQAQEASEELIKNDRHIQMPEHEGIRREALKCQRRLQ